VCKARIVRQAQWPSELKQKRPQTGIIESIQLTIYIHLSDYLRKTTDRKDLLFESKPMLCQSALNKIVFQSGVNQFVEGGCIGWNTI
jgi:hypothetical protein